MKKDEAKPASPFMALKETAEHFRVSVSSVSKSIGEFGRLRRVRMNGRILILREDVEMLDRELQRQAKAPADAVRLLEKPLRKARGR